MLYFKENKCDVVVLEVGLGGRLDATNIIKNPVLSVITGIALDHTAILGDTVGAIAAEKAGIIKPSCPVLLGCTSAEKDREDIENVIALHANASRSPLYITDLSEFAIRSTSLDGSIIDYKEHKNIHIPLLGLYQMKNAANVLAAVDILRGLGYDISEDSLKNGLNKTHWKARFEKLSDSPVMFFDGSHNPQGVLATVQSVKEYFRDKKAIVVTGVMADKSYTEMAEVISSIASEIFALTPNNPRALSADDLAAVYRSLNVNASACDSIENAVKCAVMRAEHMDAPILFLGSLYMYGDVKKAIISAQNKAN